MIVLTRCAHLPAGPRWEGVSEEACTLVRELLVVDPRERLTAIQASQHSWFKGPHEHHHDDLDVAENDGGADTILGSARKRAAEDSGGSRDKSTAAASKKRRCSGPAEAERGQSDYG